LSGGGGGGSFFADWALLAIPTTNNIIGSLFFS